MVPTVFASALGMSVSPSEEVTAKSLSVQPSLFLRKSLRSSSRLSALAAVPQRTKESERTRKSRAEKRIRNTLFLDFVILRLLNHRVDIRNREIGRIVICFSRIFDHQSGIAERVDVREYDLRFSESRIRLRSFFNKYLYRAGRNNQHAGIPGFRILKYVQGTSGGSRSGSGRHILSDDARRISVLAEIYSGRVVTGSIQHFATEGITEPREFRPLGKGGRSEIKTRDLVAETGLGNGYSSDSSE